MANPEVYGSGNAAEPDSCCHSWLPMWGRNVFSDSSMKRKLILSPLSEAPCGGRLDRAWPIRRFLVGGLPALVAVLVSCLALIPVSAQQPTKAKTADLAASIRGTVTTMQDNAATVVAGITVKLSGDALHGAPLTADTDEHGIYDFKNLAPGAYTVSIDLQGFKPVNQIVVLASKQQLVADFTLQLNVVAEKVEVK